MKSRFFLLIVLTIFTLLVVGCSDSASGSAGDSEDSNDYPSDTISLVVPYSAGGTTDVIARLVAENSSKYLPNEQNIIVENVPGGNAAVGSVRVLNSDADGYTGLVSGYSTLTVRPHLEEDAEFTYDSFQPVANLVNTPQMLITNEESGWETLDDLIEHLETTDDNVNIGSIGYGGFQHLVIEMLNLELGDRLDVIQFDGSAEVTQGILEGSISLAITGAPSLIGNDELTPIAATGMNRATAYPDVPTLTEKDINVEGDLFMGAFLPEGTDEEKVEVLADAFRQALEEPELIEQLENMGYEVTYENPEEWQETITESYNRFGEVIEKANLAQ